MDDKHTFFQYFIVVAVLIIGVAGLWALMSVGSPGGQGPQYFVSKIPSPDKTKLVDQGGGQIIQPVGQDSTVLSFASEAEFKEYLEEAESLFSSAGFGLVNTRMALPMMADIAFDTAPSIAKEENAMGLGSGGETVDRFSTTNVQVQGIDEPDILKTDGEEIYFSSPAFYTNTEPMMDDRLMMPEIGIMPPRSYGGIRAIDAFPPADLAVDATIDTQGDLLLSDDILMVFSGNIITGYDVSDPSQPDEEWDIKLDNRSWIVASRLKGDKLYLVTRTSVSPDRLCPIVPLTTRFGEVSIPCTGIYHPVMPIPVDSTYTIYEIDPDSGRVERLNSFVGSSGNSVVYMSADALYITYQQPGDILTYLVGFFRQNSDLFPGSLTDKLSSLARMDISQQAKLTEVEVLLSNFEQGLNDDDRLRLENETADRISDYEKDHYREIDRTGIVKIALPALNMAASGSVPGSPLNQFALDEYKGNLRIATTIGGNSWFFRFDISTGESVSDVTILDDQLRQLGTVQDLGRTERIYSVRFIGDKGYVVTFRQTDPFYVLDLSNPSQPRLRGELKIPGFSSYLHPISDNLILGVGREGSQVKLSLFEVSDPSDPQEADKYMLDEYWTEVENNHHAFLMDNKHGIFFLPGSRGGYIFSYEDEKLSLARAVSNINARRALFINDYLYIVGDDRLVIMDENDWTRVNEIDF